MAAVWFALLWRTWVLCGVHGGAGSDSFERVATAAAIRAASDEAKEDLDAEFLSEYIWSLENLSRVQKFDSILGTWEVCFKVRRPCAPLICWSGQCLGPF